MGRCERSSPKITAMHRPACRPIHIQPLPCAQGAAANEQVVTLANIAGWQIGTIFFE